MTTEAALASPCTEERGDPRARIIAAAEAAFVAQGFRLTTMDMVARGAGCSKKTLYKFFNSKEELFQALLTCARHQIGCLPLDTSLPPEEALEAFLRDIARVILRDSHIALMRIAVAEAGQLFQTPTGPAGEPEMARLALDDYLAELRRSGDYDIPGPTGAAQMLIGMALGAFHHELLAGLEARVPESALVQRIRDSVRIFLRGCRIHPA